MEMWGPNSANFLKVIHISGVGGLIIIIFLFEQTKPKDVTSSKWTY